MFISSYPHWKCHNWTQTGGTENSVQYNPNLHWKAKSMSYIKMFEDVFLNATKCFCLQLATAEHDWLSETLAVPKLKWLVLHVTMALWVCPAFNHRIYPHMVGCIMFPLYPQLTAPGSIPMFLNISPRIDASKPPKNNKKYLKVSCGSETLPSSQEHSLAP